MAKYYCPTWELTKEASLRGIERSCFAVQQSDTYDDIYFIPNFHNPIKIINEKRIYYDLNFLIPINPGLSFVFSKTDVINGKKIKPKGFHKNLFLDILEKSFSEDCYDGYFYILECCGHYKVGITQDYNSRKRTYITENPHPICEIFAGKIYCADRVESYLKKVFRHKKHKGEWFNFSRRDLFFIEAALGNILIS